MNNIGDLGDASKAGPLLKAFADEIVGQLVAKAVPALQAALSAELDGLTVTITISRKVSQ